VIPDAYVIGLAVLLFTIGVIGVLLRRNLIVILLGLQLMFAAAGLAFVGFNRRWAMAAAAEPHAAGLDGQVFALFAIGIAALELALGLAVLLTLVRNRDSLNVEDASLLRW
jgi:NADH-quinone oxidoreductase subunit K